MRWRRDRLRVAVPDRARGVTRQPGALTRFWHECRVMDSLLTQRNDQYAVVDTARPARDDGSTAVWSN